MCELEVYSLVSREMFILKMHTVNLNLSIVRNLHKIKVLDLIEAEAEARRALGVEWSSVRRYMHIQTHFVRIHLLYLNLINHKLTGKMILDLKLYRKMTYRMNLILRIENTVKFNFTRNSKLFLYINIDQKNNLTQTDSCPDSPYFPATYSTGKAPRPIGVMDPGFQRTGHLKITRQLIGRRQKFILCDPVYPIDGHCLLNVDCHAEQNAAHSQHCEHRSFLSLYQVVSGFGSWTRYWCRLANGELNFWRYPEDETTKVNLTLFKKIQILIINF